MMFQGFFRDVSRIFQNCFTQKYLLEYCLYDSHRSYPIIRRASEKSLQLKMLEDEQENIRISIGNFKYYQGL